MTMFKYLAAGVAAMGFAAPAMAQSPAAAPAGFRIEGVVGIDQGSAYGQHATGLLYGVGAGYDFAVGNTVSLGIDAEGTDATTDASGAQAGLDLYAGGRANFAVSPRANLYVKAGYTRANLDFGNDSDRHSGARAGVGGQVAISGKTYVGLEYRYSHYHGDFNRHQGVLTVGTRF